MMLGRTIDKAHATLQGLLGEYMYDCPLDKVLFGFLGVSANQLLELAENSENVAQYLEGKEILRKIYVKNKLVNLVVK